MSSPNSDMDIPGSNTNQIQPSTSSQERGGLKSPAVESDGLKKRFKALAPVDRSTQTTPDHESELDNDDATSEIVSLIESGDLSPRPQAEDDLDTKCYAELKKMFANPELRSLYGDDLILATWKANFKRMTLDLLQSIDRNLIPQNFRYLLDEVIESKTYEKELAALNAVDDEAYRKYFPHDLNADQEILGRYRVAEYKEGRQIVFPPRRLR